MGQHGESEAFEAVQRATHEGAEVAWQVSAFKDFTPGQGGGSAAPAASSGEPEGEEEDGGEEGGEEGEASGSGRDYPPHTLMGLPALSPTMSQGEAPPALKPNMTFPNEVLQCLTACLQSPVCLHLLRGPLRMQRPMC